MGAPELVPCEEEDAIVREDIIIREDLVLAPLYSDGDAATAPNEGDLHCTSALFAIILATSPCEYPSDCRRKFED